ncbi:LOW QUALITY PROTEIN: uncharacterized protein LOC118800643 [Colossoma macropomum]|uniref:LOW QUALITY PROTEIN: uncharacterized protein LOC118800643 n=1 Tax=Colossoma macropomum TaxID=42526 RepID=UPI0018650011|nr:LOW QUALITY PROTEIN: uncharacterized protein LOC118800643 [Colossoma macropomum]
MELHHSSSGGRTSDSKVKRAASPEPSFVSEKRYRSMENPSVFSRGGGEPSCVSMKSNWFMGEPPKLNRGGGEPSCVSVKSDRSMGNPPVFSSGGGEPSCVSMKSDESMMLPAQSSGGRGSSDSGQHSTQTALQINTLADIHQPVDDILHRVLERHKTSIKNKYESLFEGIRTEENKTLLNRIYAQLYIIEGESEGVNEEHEVLQMEKTSRRHLQDSPINCLDIFKPLPGPGGETQEENIRAVKADRKEDNRPKEPELRSVLTKGIAGIGKTVSVQKFILDWAEGKANQDVELMFVLPFRELNLIKDDQYSLHGLLCDFHPELKDLDPKIYDQLKAVFIFDGLDESRIPLNFEQCEKVSDITMTSSVGVLMTNLIKGELLPSALIWITSRPAAANQIPPKYIKRVTEIQGFSDPQKEEYFRKRISDEDQAKKIISHIKRARSLHIMCHIPVFCWISATVLQQIMKQRHTEVPKTLTEMYSHFLLTQTNMNNEKYEEKDERYPKNLLESNRTVILKLAELAFKQLMMGNVMFYEEDLRESSIDVTEASVYSGIYSEIFREECVLHQRKVYCFFHLSFQEFLAAVYVFHCYESNNMEGLQIFNPLNSETSENDLLRFPFERYREWSTNILLRFPFQQYREWSKYVLLDEVLMGAVNKAVESQNGHLDLFLRFLLGISLESNQRRLQSLLTPTQSSSERTTEHIKRLIKGEDKYHISTERFINLFLCLSEMNDASLSREIQEYVNSERHSEEKLSPGQCSVLAYMILNSEEVLDELDLKKYNTSEEGYRRLIPALTVCREARPLNNNNNNQPAGELHSLLQQQRDEIRELQQAMRELEDDNQYLRMALRRSDSERPDSPDLSYESMKKSSISSVQLCVESKTSVMELHHSSNGGRTSDSKVKRAGSPEPSYVSVKSDWSMGNPPLFSRGGGEHSCVSVKSDWSMGNPPLFSRGGGEPSCVSMKSDRSMGNIPAFSRGGGEPSCVSVKSDWSMGNPPLFSSGGEPSCVSMKSDRSMMLPAQSSGGRGSSDSGQHSTQTALQTNTLADIHQPVDDDVLHRVLERHKTSMKNKYESLFEGIRTEENKTLLNRIYTQLYIIEGESEGVNEEHEVLQMEKTSRRRLQDSPINCLDIFKPLQGPEGETLEENIRAVKADSLRHKERKEDNRPKEPELRSVLTKGIAGIGKTVSVQKFILDWAEGKANQDVELMFVLPFRELNLIKDDQYSLHGLLCDFHPELKDLDPKIYDQLKAVFIFDGLDESRIPLNFEQCEKVSDITMTSSVGVLMTNLIKGELLPSVHIWITSRPAAANPIPPKCIKRVTEIQGFSDPQKEEYFRKRISDEDQAKRIISHIKRARSLHIMCHIPVFCWISATVLQQIMKQHHTEIPKTLTEMYSHFLLTQTNMKNEKYEKKKRRNPKNLLESNRTILLKLAELAFKQLMKGNAMFYEEDLRESSIDVTEASVYSGIFAEIFREECVLYQRKVYCFVHLSFQEFLAAVYVFHCYESKNMEELQIFNSLSSEWSENVQVSFFNQQKKRPENVLVRLFNQQKKRPENVLVRLFNQQKKRSEKVPLDEVLKGAVNKAVESQNGHLDLFLRFLLGISLESNQRRLQGLLTPTQSSSERTTEHIKRLIKGDGEQYDIYSKRSIISTERSINLFLCLSEMKDQSLSREIREYLKSERHSEEELSPGQCSALAYMILNSEEVLDELDLKKYNTSEEGYRRLIPALTVCRKARLGGCGLTTNSCENLSSALQSVNSSLKELDLSNNDLQDSGVELLSAGLNNSHCKLERLRLHICSLGAKACENLGSVLQSPNSSLRELDLSNNDLQDSGVELLSAGLKSSFCKLETLRLSGCMVTDEGCSSLASALKSNPSHLRELDLTYNHPGESGVKLLSDLLEDPHCKLEKLQVDHGGKIRTKPGLKKYAVNLTLDPNTVYRNLSLSERNRKVKWVRDDQRYPDHPDRFDHWSQVLSVESLTGRCYWEVQWSGLVYISVSYRGIRRKGHSEDCVFGINNHSWSLICSNNSYSLYHNKQRTVLPATPSPPNTVGVYLDWGSNTLSFYTISPNTHTLTHLHTFTTTFTEPLYAGFWVYPESSVSLCEIE